MQITFPASTKLPKQRLLVFMSIQQTICFKLTPTPKKKAISFFSFHIVVSILNSQQSPDSDLKLPFPPPKKMKLLRDSRCCSIWADKIGLLLCHSHIELRLWLRLNWGWYWGWDLFEHEVEMKSSRSLVEIEFSWSWDKLTLNRGRNCWVF